MAEAEFSETYLREQIQAFYDAQPANTNYESLTEAFDAVSHVVVEYMNRFFMTTEDNTVIFIPTRKERSYRSFRDESTRFNVCFTSNRRQGMHSIQYTKLWLEHIDHRRGKLMFLPTGAATPDEEAKIASGEIINTYRGPAITREMAQAADESKAEPFKRHLLENVCGGIMEHFIFISTALALLVQYPGIKHKWAFVLFGPGGTGKSAIVRLITYILGDWNINRPVLMDQVIGRFNSSMGTSVCTSFEETHFSGNPMEGCRVRNLITEETMNLERKGKDVELGMRLFGLFFFFTNNELAWLTTEGERRAYVRKMTRKFTEQQWRDYGMAGLDPGVRGSDPLPVAKWLYNIDVSNFTPIQPPVTTDRGHQTEMQLSTLEQWCENIMMTGRIRGIILSHQNATIVPYEEVYNSFQEFANRLGARYHKNTCFRGLERLIGVTSCRQGQKQVALRRFPPVSEMVACFRAAKEIPDWYSEYDDVEYDVGNDEGE